MSENTPQDKNTGGLNEYAAARILGVSVSTMRAWRFRSRGPSYIKAGRRCVYFEVDLEAYKTANRIQPGQV